MSGTEVPREPSTNRGALPWARRDEVGGLRGFFLTIRGLLTGAGSLYSALDSRRPMTEPLVFAVLVMLIGQGLEMIVLAAIGPFLPDRFAAQDVAFSLGSFGGESWAALPSGLVSFFGLQLAILSLPLVALVMLVMLLLWSGLSHVGLAILGGTRTSRSGFRGTLAVYCYASAASLAQVVPLLGDVLFFGLALLWAAIGLRRVHGASRLQATVAAVSPPLLVAAGSIAALMLGT